MKLLFYFDKIKKSEFLNASFYSAISSVIKILTSLLIGKIIVHYADAEGIVLYGQLLNFVVIISVFCGGAISQGLIKYVAEYNAVEKEKIPALLATSFKFTLSVSLFIGLILVLFSKYISQQILFAEKYSSIFVVFGLTLVFYALNTYFLSVLNGYKQFKKFNLINIILNIISLLLSLILSYYFNVYGILLSVIVSQSFLFFITIYLLKNENWFQLQNFKNPINLSILKLLLRFALVAILSTALAPISALIVRDHLIVKTSVDDAGMYELAFRIANAVIMFFTLTISTYYIPRISEINTKSELLKEVKKTYILVMPIIIVLLIGVYFTKELIILILAKANFLRAASLFGFVLFGVFLKVITQIVGFVFLAKAKIKTVIALEVALNIFITLLSIYFINIYGLLGSVYAYCITNLIFLVIVLALFFLTFVSNKKSINV